MAGRVPRMRRPASRQLVGTRGGVRLDASPGLTARQVKDIVIANSSSSASSGDANDIHIVVYTATGAEGASFMVPIGATMDDTSYNVAWAPGGIQNVPLLDLPNASGDRTTTQFKVLIGGMPLAAGEVLVFIVFPLTTNTARIVSYTVTGAEGSDFNVGIGATLSNDEYGLIWSPTGLTTVPLLDLPTADRTTTSFRVLVTGGALTVGDKLTFFVFEKA